MSSSVSRPGLSIADLRREYGLEGLSEEECDPDPFAQFAAWFRDAMDAGVYETNAMTLATASADGRPSARIVLLKGFDDHGFVFYTNYESRKGRDLAQNPYATLLFYWPELTRQVRVEGAVARVTEAESHEYFQSRGELSRLGAWASNQSQIISGRDELDERMNALIIEYQGRDIPTPPFWGGYRLTPSSFEFWHGRPSRLHDRLYYTRQEDCAWRVERLSP
ncbi:MAG TPA: pyridoxamine 5'-phosphate oxidase [Thermomicrobiales bacterium]|nr:pyridoxamine 5'-phosphate oxidase [Thermomicrobiales bacterium]